MIVKTQTFKEFRILIKLCYLMGYKFNTGKQYNPFLMWIGWHGFYPIRGVVFYDFENSKRIKYCDLKSWEKVDYVEFNEFMLMLSGAI